MSRKGPTLLRSPRGFAYAKFNDQKISFGRFDDPEAQTRFERFKGRWFQNDRQLPEDSEPGVEGDCSIGQLCDEYLAHVNRRYNERWRKNNLTRYEQALKPLRELCGDDPAASFSPKRLRAVRDRMIDSRKLVRSTMNVRVNIIKKAFRWGVSEELLPKSLSHALADVESIREGEYATKEGRTRGPVDEESFRATLPYQRDRRPHSSNFCGGPERARVSCSI